MTKEEKNIRFLKRSEFEYDLKQSSLFYYNSIRRTNKLDFIKSYSKQLCSFFKEKLNKLKENNYISNTTFKRLKEEIDYNVGFSKLDENFYKYYEEKNKNIFFNF